ncbi:MAG: NCS2 family permease [Dysosmobacter welbionis]
MNSTIGNRSIFERVFHLSERGTTLRTELIAGATTFLSCVSIMVLNPTILAAAGMDQKAVFWATALSSCIGCLWIGLWGNFPFALGPAMGLNSYMAYTVVQGMGLSWQNGLACVFTSGCVFMLLSAFKTQQHIVDAVPDCVKKAIGAGVGMFIAFCGFQSAGLIQKSDSTLVTVGDLSNPGTVLALAGIAITAVLVIRQVKGGILIGILLVTVLGLFVKDPVTGAAYTTLPTSVFSFDNPAEALAPTLGQLSYRGMFSGPLPFVLGTIFAIVSFLFVDLFDSLGVFLGIAPKAGLVDEDGKTPGAGKALFVSAGAAAVGAVLGTSTVTIYGAESAAGIAAGGRTGLTACGTGLLFLLTLFFSPVFLMISQHCSSACAHHGRDFHDGATLHFGSFGFFRGYAGLLCRRSHALYVQYRLWCTFFHAQLHSLHGSDRQKKAALSHDADPNGSLFDVLDSGRYFLTEWRVVLC